MHTSARFHTVSMHTGLDPNTHTLTHPHIHTLTHPQKHPLKWQGAQPWQARLARRLFPRAGTILGISMRKEGRTALIE